jgi:hypothetical protein
MGMANSEGPPRDRLLLNGTNYRQQAAHSAQDRAHVAGHATRGIGVGLRRAPLTGGSRARSNGSVLESADVAGAVAAE